MTGLRFLRIGLAVGALGIFIAGCTNSAQREMARDRLQQARNTYQAAKADPDVQASAPLLMVDAQNALEAGESTTNPDKILHYAYMADKKARTAQAIADGRRAEQELTRIKEENANILLSKREREAQRAREEAAARGKELEEARRDIERRSGEAEEARKQAQMRAQEAERARQESERAKAEVERARVASEQARTESEKARAEADRLKAESDQARAEVERAKAENQQLVVVMSELQAKETERGVVLTMGDVLFPTGKADISTQAKRSIDKLADFLSSHKGRNVLIEGHTDNVGGDAYNMDLSQRRAQAVKNELVGRGISADRIATKGYGKRFPVASNDNAHGRQLNRRVEVVILNEGVKPESMYR